MTILEAILNNNVAVNISEEFLYNSETDFLDGKKRFPRVEFCLIASNYLCKMADELREKGNHMPLLFKDGEFGKDYDPYGWYNFYYGVSGGNEYKVDKAIAFSVASDFARDDGEIYYIELSSEEQKLLYECIDKQFKMELGKSVEDILEEARKEMEA